MEEISNANLEAAADKACEVMKKDREKLAIEQINQETMPKLTQPSNLG